VLLLEKLKVVIGVLFRILVFSHLRGELADRVASEYRVLKLNFIVFTTLIPSRPGVPFILSLSIVLLVAVGVSLILLSSEDFFIGSLREVNVNALLW
jgi:hypothetical protein